MPAASAAARVDNEDMERVALLTIVSRGQMKSMSAGQLRRLEELVSKKDYSHDRKAEKSKKKLLAKINVRMYEIAEEQGSGPEEQK